MSDLLSGHSVLLAVLTAFASACGFAVATSFQHHASGRTPDSARSLVRVFLHLVSQPMWLAGASLGVLALVLHAAALNMGTLAVVQPVMVSGIVVALPIRAALSRHLPSMRELRSVGLTACGLAVFLVTADPAPTRFRPETLPFALVATGALVASVVIASPGSRGRPHGSQALRLGVASGILFGLTAALLKLIAVDVSDGGLRSLLTSWPLVALICLGAVGTAFNQRAYRIAALSASMPVLSVVEVIVALTLGAVLFGEAPAHSPAAVLAQVAALGCIATGLWLVARSSVQSSQTGPSPGSTAGSTAGSTSAAGQPGATRGESG